MDYIRLRYGVPAKRGGEVLYGSKMHGVITGAEDGYLKIRLDGEKRSKRYHPTYNITYL